MGACCTAEYNYVYNKKVHIDFPLCYEEQKVLNWERKIGL